MVRAEDLRTYLPINQHEEVMFNFSRQMTCGLVTALTIFIVGGHSPRLTGQTLSPRSPPM